jgi:hypothetical protein
MAIFAATAFVSINMGSVATIGSKEKDSRIMILLLQSILKFYGLNYNYIETYV